MNVSPIALKPYRPGLHWAEAAPASLIFRIQLVDAMHRGHTQPSNTLIGSNYADELAHHPEPQPLRAAGEKTT